MASVQNIFLVLTIVSLTTIIQSPTRTSAQKIDIGVCYGMLGNNLPPEVEVIALYKKYGIGKLRLFYPNPDALDALRGSNIDVTLGISNEDIPGIAASSEVAANWFQAFVAPYLEDVNFAFISVGNEAIPSYYGNFIPAAMKNIKDVLDDRNLQGITVTTTVAASVLTNTYPPSSSVFSQESMSTMAAVLDFLSSTGSPILMINVYPYFAYASDPTNVGLDFAQFTATVPKFQDGNLSYYNLFDAMVDGFFWAMEKVNASAVGVAVSATGWPSGGNGDLTTPELAYTYNKNFVKHILSGNGTPKRPGNYIEGFIFAMFNENQKPKRVERNWGLFYPNKNPLYPLFS